MTGAAHQLACVDTSPISATDPLSEVPKARWWELMVARRQFAETTFPFDCRCIEEFCLDCEEMFGVIGFSDAKEMIREGLGLHDAELRLFVEWLRLYPQDEAVPLEAARVMALAAHGGDRRSEEFQVGNAKLKSSEGGMTAVYIIARLERDGQHELAGKVRAGQISANAAAHEAGFRKQLSPFEIAFRQIPKLTTEERQQLKEALQ